PARPERTGSASADRSHRQGGRRLPGHAGAASFRRRPDNARSLSLDLAGGAGPAAVAASRNRAKVGLGTGKRTPRANQAAGEIGTREPFCAGPGSSGIGVARFSGYTAPART